MVCFYKCMDRLVVLFVLWVSYIGSTLADHCIHPPNATSIKQGLYKDILRDYVLSGNPSYHIIPSFHKTVQRRQHAKIHSYHEPPSQPRRTKIYGERRCKKTKQIFRRDGPMSQSTCPWYIEMEVDTYREPRSMAKARCSCRRCHPPTGNSRPKEGMCSTIDSYVPVIRWRCPINAGPHYEYFVDLETVPVGCTCNRARKG